jgi:hypothetical protein
VTTREESPAFAMPATSWRGRGQLLGLAGIGGEPTGNLLGIYRADAQPCRQSAQHAVLGIC